MGDEGIGVREFRDHATTCLSGTEPVAVSKHGQVIGLYLDTGMTEDEFAAYFDTSRPLPE